MSPNGLERRSELNDVAFGRLLEGQEAVKDQIDKLTVKVENIEERLNTGKGIMTGALLAAGSLGGSIGAIAHKLFEGLNK